MIDKMLGLGLSPLYLTSLMGLLGIHPDELTDPVRFERFKDVAERLKDNKNYSYILNKITVGKQVDKLDHAWGYTQLEYNKEKLLKKKAEVQDNLNVILRLAGDKQITDPNDVVGYGDYSKMLSEVNDGLRQIDEEMGFYAR